MRLPEAVSARHRGSGRLTVGAAVVALLVGAWLIDDGTTVTGPPRPPGASSDDLRSAGTSGLPSSIGPSAGAVPALPASVPTRMRIPALKVDAPITGIGLDAQQQLVPPPVGDRNLVGWYREGAAPGAVGAAIAVGHVDGRSGGSVFYRLRLLHRGDTVEVARADHRTAVFTVDSVQLYPKAAFPSAAVYGSTARPELRLITCGGHFSRKDGYDANVVVYTHLTAVR